MATRSQLNIGTVCRLYESDTSVGSPRQSSYEVGNIGGGQNLIRVNQQYPVCSRHALYRMIQVGSFKPTFIFAPYYFTSRFSLGIRVLALEVIDLLLDFRTFTVITNEQAKIFVVLL